MKLLGLFTLLLLGHFTTNDAAIAEEAKWEQSTWLWHTSKIVEAPDEVLEFLNQKDVTNVYLQINRDIDPDSYRSFIAKASSDNIHVFALDGSKYWIEDQKRFNDYLNWVEQYQNGSSEQERFAGLHLDVEPYLHEMWDEDYQNAILQYQNIISEAAQKAKTWDIRFAADIPFWYDTKYYDNEQYGKGLLHNWVIDTADEVGIMAYRNFAEGGNGIIELSTNEIQYAQEVGKKVIVGVETKPLTSYDHLSFSELGEDKMNDELNKVYNEFGDAASFNGIAIHSFKYWQELNR